MDFHLYSQAEVLPVNVRRRIYSVLRNLSKHAHPSHKRRGSEFGRQFSAILVRAKSHFHAPQAPHISKGALLLLGCYSAVVLAHLLISAMFVWSQHAVSYTHPLPFSFLRCLTAIPIVWVLAHLEKAYKHFDRQDLPEIALLGALGVTIPQCVLFYGITMAGAQLASCLQPAMPVWASLTAMLIHTEKGHPVKFAGVLTTVIGALCTIQVWKVQANNSKAAWGALLVICNTLSYGVYLVLFHRACRKRPFPYTLNLHVTLAGTLFLAPIALPFFKDKNWTKVPAQAFGAIAFAGAVTSGIGLSLNGWATKHLNGVVPAMACALQPIFTALINYVALGKVADFSSFWGLTLIILGLAMVIYIKYRDIKAAQVEQKKPRYFEESTASMSQVPLLAEDSHAHHDFHNDASLEAWLEQNIMEYESSTDLGSLTRDTTTDTTALRDPSVSHDRVLNEFKITVIPEQGETSELTRESFFATTSAGAVGVPPDTATATTSRPHLHVATQSAVASVSPGDLSSTSFYAVEGTPRHGHTISAVCKNCGGWGSGSSQDPAQPRKAFSVQHALQSLGGHSRETPMDVVHVCETCLATLEHTATVTGSEDEGLTGVASDTGSTSVQVAAH